MVGRRRDPAHRPGFALQLGTVCLLGTFLADPTAVPAPIIGYAAAQVGMADLGCLKGYGESRAPRQRPHPADLAGVLARAEVSELYVLWAETVPVAAWAGLRHLAQHAGLRLSLVVQGRPHGARPAGRARGSATTATCRDAGPPSTDRVPLG